MSALIAWLQVAQAHSAPLLERLAQLYLFSRQRQRRGHRSHPHKQSNGRLYKSCASVSVQDEVLWASVLKYAIDLIDSESDYYDFDLIKI